MRGNSFQSYLEALHGEFAGLRDGAVASYIPELLKADPEWFGIALITTDGHVYQVGESRQPFTIQSISKAITYGLALEDKGIEAVLRKVDVEPSGEAFNSISLEPVTGRPRNPMINAGAIATVGLVDGDTADQRFAHMLKCYERYLGRAVTMDADVYRSEKATGHRNRAIAWLLHNSDIIEKDTEEVLDVYFRQCSILVTCRDLALIGATLANDGVNPITGVRALQSRLVPKTLSVMSSCGMYDFSGAWVYDVGMPAKSGVGGGIMAVLPGQLGLAVFSPPLDERGNSARGIAVCRRFSRDFSLHTYYSATVSVASVVHTRHHAGQVPSKRSRNAEHSRLLAEIGNRIEVLELQGRLVFASAEIVIREAMSAIESAEMLILDFARVGVIEEGALSLLVDLVHDLHRLGKTVLLSGVSGKYQLVRRLSRRIPGADALPLLAHDDVDDALEWCEDRLLAGCSAPQEGEMPLAVQPFCADMLPDELQLLESLLERRRYAKGEYLCREGDLADNLFFVMAGEVSVRVRLDTHRTVRISAVGAGVAVGEMAMLDRGRRSADIVADTDVSCLVFQYDRFESCTEPQIAQIHLKLVGNIARVLTRKLRQATAEIQLLRS